MPRELLLATKNAIRADASIRPVNCCREPMAYSSVGMGAERGSEPSKRMTFLGC